MKKIAQLNDQTKIAFLAVGVVLVFGNIVWRYTHAENGAAAVGTQDDAEQLDGTGPVAKAAKPLYELVASKNPPTVDIFREVLPETSSRPITPPTPSYQQRAPSALSQRFASLPMPAPEITGSLGPLPPAGTTSPQTSALTPAQPPAPEVRLTGIITGEFPVAMLTLDGKRYVAREGEDFAQGAKILRIAGRSVIVRISGQKLTLKL